jgi:hypothetical protein
MDVVMCGHTDLRHFDEFTHSACWRLCSCTTHDKQVPRLVMICQKFKRGSAHAHSAIAACRSVWKAVSWAEFTHIGSKLLP